MKISKWIWIPLSSILLVAVILFGVYKFAYNYSTNRIINDLADAPKTSILKNKPIILGNLVIPAMPGWEDLTVYNQAPVTSLTFMKQIDLDKDVDMTLSFDYEPAKNGEKPNVKERASRMIEGASKLNVLQTHVTVINPHPAEFQHWPAYLFTTHMVDRYPRSIDTDDIRTMVFSDGKDTYIIELDIANSMNVPKSHQVADQVWKKILTESKIANADYRTAS
jgi:hypothetical protein